MVKLLLSYYDQDNKFALKSLQQAFILAARWQKLEYMKLILGVSGPDFIHSRDSNGRTVIYEAIARGDKTEVFEFLLASGADVNAVDNACPLGASPLMFAVNYGRPECAKGLLVAGAAVNYLVNACTPLDIVHLSDLGGYKESDKRDECRAKMVEVLKAAGGLTAAEIELDMDTGLGLGGSDDSEVGGDDVIG